MNSKDIVKGLDEGILDSINSHSVQGKEIYTVDPSSKHADQMISSHFRAEKDLDGKIEPIVDRMFENKEYRNFICMNYQHFLGDNNGHKLIESRNFGGSTLRIARKFGFKRPNKKNVVDDGTTEDFIQKLTSHYEKYYNSYLYSNYGGLSYEKHLFDPLMWTTNHLDVYPSETTRTTNYFYVNAKNKTVASFLTLYTISKFYERYINRIFEETLDVESVVSNPAIIYAPPSKNGTIKKYAELDGFLIFDEQNSYIIECKNSGTIWQSNITNFMGKAAMIEDIYNINLEKVLVSTGSFNGKTNGLRSMNTGSLKIFDHRDHKNNYQQLIEFLD